MKKSISIRKLSLKIIQRAGIIQLHQENSVFVGENDIINLKNENPFTHPLSLQTSAHYIYTRLYIIIKQMFNI